MMIVTKISPSYIQANSSHVENFKAPQHAGHEPEELLAIFVPFDGVERGVSQAIVTVQGGGLTQH